MTFESVPALLVASGSALAEPEATRVRTRAGAYDAGSLRLLTGSRRSWLRRVHRALAIVVALCLASFQLEAMIADVCDGDASPAEVAALIGPASDLPRDAAQTAATHLGLSVTPQLTRPPVASDARGTDTGLSGVPSPAGHPAHTCHCVHAHGGLLPRLDSAVVHVVDVATPPPVGYALGASDVVLVPLPRPPLA